MRDFDRHRPTIARFAFGAAMLCTAAANAYEIGGHHYTLNSLLAVTAPIPDRERAIVTWCALLPDLSTDLDATVLRARVTLSWNDWGWGVSGTCQTNTSQQMVAAQFYVHALTGLDVSQVRAAARQLSARLSGDLFIVRRDFGAERDNRLCEYGVSLHLLGDTFAHSQLDNQQTLYPTGFGHFRDEHAPDYMLRRNYAEYVAAGNRWNDWVELAGMTLQSNANAAPVKKMGDDLTAQILAGPSPDALKTADTESKMSQALLASAQNWNLAPNGGWLQPSVFKPRSGPSCADQIKQLANAFAAGGRFAPPAIDCGRMWAMYLLDADKAFGALKPAETSCQIRVDANGNPRPVLE